MNAILPHPLRRAARVALQGMVILLLLAGQLPIPASLGPTRVQAGPIETGPADAVSRPASTLPSMTAGGSQAPGLDLSSAYVRDTALPDGTRQALVSTIPINYQAADGSWQPIDPRFEAVAGGFENSKNNLVISAGQSKSILRLRNGQAAVGWEPLALLLDDREVAHVLADEEAAAGTLSADGQTILYPGSWSLAALQDTVTAEPGQVEQSLVLAEPLKKEGETLALQANLRLLPGGQIYAQGAIQSATFTTAGPVEVHDAQGQTVLVLAAPSAFEQGNPAAQVAGSYRLTPLDEGTWQVAVETPWSWWNDPARVYPLVLDPKMQVLKPGYAVSVYSEGSCSWPQQPGDEYVDCVQIGRRPECTGVYRALIRFDDLPLLPTGYQVMGADLLAAPVRGYYPGSTAGFSLASADVQLYRVTGEWIPGLVGWGEYSTAPSPLGTQHLMVYSPEYWAKQGRPPTHTTGHWTLQVGDSGMVTDWIQHRDNYGLELRLADEAPCSEQDCHFIEIPRDNYWSDSDVEMAPYSLGLSERGGFMLLIAYMPPQLAEGETHYNLDLPTDSPDMAGTLHSYRLPDHTGAWTVAAVKGLGEAPYMTRTVYVAEGWLGADLFQDFGNGMGAQYPSFVPGEPNYVLANEDVSPFAFRVYPPFAPDPANANLSLYSVQAANSTPFADVTFVPNTVYTQTFVMSSEEIVRAFDLNLVENTNARVDITLDGPVEGNTVKARVFRPGEEIYPKSKATHLVELNKPFRVEDGETGNWGLVLEFQGDVGDLSTDQGASWTDPQGPDGAAPDVERAYEFTVSVAVRACAPNAVPVNKGPCPCQVIDMPDDGTPHEIVGNFVVYSDNGIDYTAPGVGTTMLGCNTSFVGWNGAGYTRLVAVAQGQISFNAGAGTLSGSNDSMVFLTNFNGILPPQLWSGALEAGPGTSPNLLPKVPYTLIDIPLGPPDSYGVSLAINVTSQTADYSATLERNVETSPGALQDFIFDLAWHQRAEGYQGDHSIALQAGAPTQADVGSLILYLGSTWSIDYDQGDPSPGRFTTLRNEARIAQPADLGSAWKPIQAIILRPGEGRVNARGVPVACTGECLDLRAPGSTPSADNPEWEMPDIEIAGLARTLAFDEPGRLTVFSTDQPNAVNAVDVPFSFRAFDTKVTLEKGDCAGTPNVVLIKGSGKIALPGLGSDTDESMMISVDSFVVCQDRLREVKISFQGPPPGIPAGSTGLFVNGISGGVSTLEGTTEIEIGLSYTIGPGVADGTASVRIDTRGLFDIQATGELLNAVEMGGHAWVAWNPLDLGVDVGAWLPYQNDHWLSGQVHAHVWQGRGWQGQYYWLPDDGETHFAGSIDATITIGEGDAFSWWWIDIPPTDINIGIWVAFGQFCTNDSCTSYEWGIKGGFTILDFDIGLYVGLRDTACVGYTCIQSIDFILGSDGHQLIDQYGTAANDTRLDAQPLVNGRPVHLNRTHVADPYAVEQDEPLTITPYAGSALVGLSWENAEGSPELSLVMPDGTTVITPGNAAAFGITVVETPTVHPVARVYFIPHPAPGGWHARITNVDPAGTDNYHLAFFANKRAPDVDLLTPAAPDESASTDSPYTIRWSVPADPPPGVDLRISLYYTATESGALTPTQSYGGVIKENIPLTDGSYDWDMSYQAIGVYQVYAKVADGATPISGTILPRPTLTGTNQIPTVQKIVAPGSIRLDDYNGPQSPGWAFVTPLHDAAMTCWGVVPDHDLSGYVVHYTAPDVAGVVRDHYLRVPATEPYDPMGTWPFCSYQCARLTGLNSGDTVEPEVAAYDANGLLGSYTLVDLPADIGEDDPDHAPGPGEWTVTVDVNHVAHVEQTTPPTGTVDGYLVYYAEDSRAGPAQHGTGASNGDSPINIGAHTYVDVDGLEPGHYYSFAVVAYDGGRRTSQFPARSEAWLTDGVDDDGDLLPDDWERAYGVYDPRDDPDGDGANNREEYEHMTLPFVPDTDYDDAFDGREHRAGTDPWLPVDFPDWPEREAAPAPRLYVAPNYLSFHAGMLGNNPAPQDVEVRNVGDGQLITSISADVPWLNLRLSGERLRVRVDRTGLASGHYAGTITITGIAGNHVENSPQQVRVDLWLFQGDLHLPIVYSEFLYLPMVIR